MLVFTSSGLYSIDKEANFDTLAVKFRRPIIPIIEVELPNDTLRVMQKPLEIYPKWFMRNNFEGCKDNTES